MTDLADLLAQQIRALRLPAPVREYRALPPRRWRCDLAWPDYRLAVEVDGGEYVRGGGRHNRAAGMAADCEKHNALAMAGWTSLRFTGAQVKRGEAIALLEQVLPHDDGLPTAAEVLGILNR